MLLPQHRHEGTEYLHLRTEVSTNESVTASGLAQETLEDTQGGSPSRGRVRAQSVLCGSGQDDVRQPFNQMTHGRELERPETLLQPPDASCAESAARALRGWNECVMHASGGVVRW